MTYYWIKILHVTTVTFNILFFALRFHWMLHRSSQLHKRWVSTLSQLNDTLLLIAGITMTLMIQQYPFVQPWLAAKLYALLAYIIFGSIALKRGQSRHIRIFAGILSFLCIGYILMVALHHDPQPFTRLFPF